MIEECREHGIPDPIFEEYSSGLSVQFIFEEPIGPRVGVMKRLSEPPSDRTLREDLLELKKLGLIGSRGRARATVWYLSGKT